MTSQNFGAGNPMNASAIVYLNSIQQFNAKMYFDTSLYKLTLLFNLKISHYRLKDIKIMPNTCLLMYLISAVISINCHVIDHNSNNMTAREAVTASLAQSLHGIADALLANSQQPCQPLPATTCEEIKMIWPSSASGYYMIRGEKIYCDMEEPCGTGGWTRLAHLNMTNSSENCPSEFRLFKSNGIRACGRQYAGPGCVSVKFQTNGISYSQVCGRVVGYQFATPDAVDPNYSDITVHNDINSHYVDGVSITRGSPRQHVWTFMAGLGENFEDRGNCPCSQESPQNATLQDFIGSDYFCESGNPHQTFRWIFFPSDPLWDGKGCGKLESACCTAPGLPWFYKVLNTTTTDYLELRVCGDQHSNDEDTPVSIYELYVK